MFAGWVAAGEAVNQILVAGFVPAIAAGLAVFWLHLIYATLIRNGAPRKPAEVEVSFDDVKAEPVVDACRIMDLIAARAMVLI